MKFKLFFILAFVFAALAPSEIKAQKPQPAQPKPAEKPAQPPTPAAQPEPESDFVTLASAEKNPAKAGFWRLEVSKDAPVNIKIESKNAPVAEIAQALANHLGVGIEMSAVMQNAKVNQNLPPATLEALLLQLAPFVLMEYEISSASPAPKPFAAYLYAYNERIPANVEFKYSQSSTFMVEGNTEEGTPEYERERAAREAELPLVVKYAPNSLSVKSRRQPIMDVGYKLAEQMNVPFTMVEASDDTVDVEFKDMLVENAFRYFPAALRLRQRVNLNDMATQPLAVVLDKPEPPLTEEQIKEIKDREKNQKAPARPAPNKKGESLVEKKFGTGVVQPEEKKDNLK